MSKNLSHYWRLAVTVAILAFLHSSSHVSFAQVPVIEANSTTQVALLNHLSGLDKDQLDKLRDLTRWFNESYGSGTAYADVYSFLRDLGLAERLTEVLNYQVRATTVYLRNWSRMRDAGFKDAAVMVANDSDRVVLLACDFMGRKVLSCRITDDSRTDEAIPFPNELPPHSFVVAILDNGAAGAMK